jgi:hypothetical protein
MKDKICTLHGVIDGVFVSYIAYIEFDSGICVFDSEQLLLQLVSTEYPDFPAIRLQQPIQNCPSERAGPSRNQDCFVGKILSHGASPSMCIVFLNQGY